MAKQEAGSAALEAVSENGAQRAAAQESGAGERAVSSETGTPPPVRPVRGFAALLLVLGATALMNGSIFPQFDAVFMFARDISVTCSAATLLALGLAAYRAPAMLRRRAIVVRAATCLVFGGALLAAGLAFASPAPLVLGACVVAIGRAAATVTTSLYLARLSSHQAAVAIAVAYTLQLAASPACAFLPAALGVVLFLAFPLVALALTAAGGGFFFDAVRDRPSPSDLSVTRPASFLAPFSALFGCLFLFQVAFGFALRFDEVAGTPRMSLFSAAPLALVVLYVALSRRRFPADGVVQFSALVVMAGFLLSAQPLLAVGGGAADVALLNAGNGLFTMAAQMALVAIAARNPLGAVTAVAWGNGVSALGSLTGAAAGMIANGLAAGSPALRAAIPAVLLLVFAAYVLVGLKRFTFAGAIDGIEPVAVSPEAAPDAARTPEEAFAARCETIAGEFSLTPREAEVFAMLARGRDRSYIEEALVVSRNTVKAHVKHVYAKLGIHSHQELIDLVEE
ncbi:response regulator transcription factor [uncultured Adlercreutzia sp.]|uniref:response regulator transcription factor n=1 Tax=uncultured Adlercreutzia sp. TaxID=875803 RepID=UPI002676DE6D|nr:helix-turn-helix transcriptional regulator [uncultured Adlercreutzia sp.]